MHSGPRRARFDREKLDNEMKVVNLKKLQSKLNGRRIFKKNVPDFDNAINAYIESINPESNNSVNLAADDADGEGDGH